MKEVDLTKSGHATVEFDARQGFIRVVGHGFVGRDAADAFLADLRAALEAARRRGPVRVLVDGRSLVAQSAETVDRLQEETGRFYRDGDRVAVLVASMLFRLQLRRSIADGFRRLFVSEEEASAWLAEP